MADRKPTTLDDLDREELLQLIRDSLKWQVVGYSERDLVWAQWQVATRRALALREQAAALSDTVIPLAGEWDAAIRARDEAGVAMNMKALDKALKRCDRASAAYKAAATEQDNIYAKADRHARRAERLYALCQELPR